MLMIKRDSQISEKDEVKDADDAESDIEILDDSAEDTIPEIEDDNFSDEFRKFRLQY